jgi:flagellar basal body-associated protein FliL
METEVLEMQPVEEKPKKDFSLLIIIIVGILLISLTSFISYKSGVKAKEEATETKEVVNK